MNSRKSDNKRKILLCEKYAEIAKAQGPSNSFPFRDYPDKVEFKKKIHQLAAHKRFRNRRSGIRLQFKDGMDNVISFRNSVWPSCLLEERGLTNEVAYFGEQKMLRDLEK